MHELSLAAELLRLVEDQARRNQIRRVTRLLLRIGKLRMVVPEMLRFAFEVTSPGSLAEGAVMDIDSVDLVARCASCDRSVTIEDFVFRCSRCGHALTEILSGRELDLVEIEGEEE